MTKIKIGSYRASRPYGFLQFVRLAVRVLLFPASSYRLIYKERKYIDVPARSLTDAKQLLLFACSHLEYGVTYVFDGRFVKITEIDDLLREEKERTQRLQALIGPPQ